MNVNIAPEMALIGLVVFMLFVLISARAFVRFEKETQRSRDALSHIK